MNIKPLRAVNQYDIVPFFSYNGATANKGTFVSAVGSGLNLKDELTLENLSSVDGTLSATFNVPWLVTAAASGAAKASVLGMLLKDVRTVDENGYPLIYDPRKAAEMDVTVSGQAAPVATKGFVLYSGIVGTPAFGSGAAIADAGDGSLKVVAATDAKSIGRFLGPKNDQGYAPLEFNLN
jgi:hypothetical protein